MTTFKYPIYNKQKQNVNKGIKLNPELQKKACKEKPRSLLKNANKYAVVHVNEHYKCSVKYKHMFSTNLNF